MLAFLEKVAEVAHSHLEKFIMPAVATVAVAAVFRDVIASWWKGLCPLPASGFRSALKMSLLGRGFRFSQDSSGMLNSPF